jgi:hypothetical protein
MLESQTLLKQKVEEAIDTLPNAGQAELLSFLDYLQHKYNLEEGSRVVQLGGLWRDLNLEISEEDIRSLRQQTTEHLLSQFEKLNA